MAIEFERDLTYRLVQLPPDHPDRKFLEGELSRFRKHTAKSQETRPDDAPTFSEGAREAIENADGMIYEKKGESIEDQKNAERPFSVGIGYKHLPDHVRETPSTYGQVAIFPNPQEFFVPRSFWLPVQAQLKLVAQDAASLRQRLGVEDIDEVIPEVAADLTDITFQHFDKTGQKLFEAFPLEFDPHFGVTQMPMSSLHIVSVGEFRDIYGIDVRGVTAENGAPGAGAVRWVVPRAA